jgi:phytoene dehydrogenase-like protein
MGAVSEAIAASARSHGAEIRTNAPVSRVLIRDGRAYGVVLENGDEIHAPIVARISIPKLTFLKLLDPKDLDPEFRAAIEHYRVEGTSLKMNLALDGLPDFTALPGSARPAARRDHAHLPFHRLRGASLGRREIRPAVAQTRCSK